MIELPEFFNNPSIIEIGNFRIQYYALTWILSAILIFQHLKRSKILAAQGLSHEQINDMVFIWGLFFGAMMGGRVGYMIFYGTEQLISNPLSLLILNIAFIKISISFRLTPINRSINLAINFKNKLRKPSKSDVRA